MTHLSYRNFDLSIEAIETAPGAANRYRVRVLDSPAGQAAGEFVLPFSPQDLEIFFLRIGRPRRGLRSLNSNEGQAALAFGRRLYDALFSGRVQAGLLRSLDLVEAQGEGLRLRLRLTGAPGLVELPWEFLYDTTHERFLAHSTATPLVRYLDPPRPMQPLPVQPPLRMLVMIANPHDHNFGQLDVEAEWGKVQTALAPLQERGLVAVTRLEAATLAALQGHLRRNRYHIFHFIGHGGFDPATHEGVLLLEDEHRRSRLVGGRRLGALLHDHPSLRLALLNACEGARTGSGDPFAGVAQHLLQQGLPAVIAMQFEITDRAAITLAREFYAALADNYPLEAALAEARKAIYNDDNDVEWGTPVLYLRTPDGRLFDVAETDGVPPPPQPKWRVWLAFAVLVLLVIAALFAALPPTRDRFSDFIGYFAPAATNIATPTADAISGMSAVARAETSTATVTPPPPGTAAGASQVQATVTVMAAQARAAMEVTAPALLPFAERFGMHFVHVPAGTFIMGNPPGVGWDYERPAHRVTLDAFWIGLTEVTNAQYWLFVEAGGYADETLWTPAGWQWRTSEKITQPGYWDYDQWNQPDLPVVGVNWYEAAAYAAWLARETGLAVRLPTEAEWERAARGDDGHTYPWGDEAPVAQWLNYAGNVGATTAVGSYPAGASPYGLLDMAGNVWEWVADWYDTRYYADAPAHNPTGPASGDLRVVRGGSWRDDEANVRSATRVSNDPYARDDNTGFRVVVFLGETATPTETPAPTATDTSTETTTPTPLPMPTSALTPTETPAPGERKTIAVAGVEFAFVYVPAGTFTMGSPPEVGADDERPAHEVALDSFWIGQTEVTNAQYRPFVDAGGYADETLWTPEGWQWRTASKIPQPEYWNEGELNQPDCPVVGVSWYEAVAYTNWLARETGLAIRLPTEAEWERAARGDDERIYPWGDEFDGARLNYCDSNCEQGWQDRASDDGYAMTAPVGRYPAGASPYGVLDMAGNVWEWLADWYGDYAVTPAQNPTGPDSGKNRVVRGGSWNREAPLARAAARAMYVPLAGATLKAFG